MPLSTSGLPKMTGPVISRPETLVKTAATTILAKQTTTASKVGSALYLIEVDTARGLVIGYASPSDELGYWSLDDLNAKQYTVTAGFTPTTLETVRGR